MNQSLMNISINSLQNIIELNNNEITSTSLVKIVWSMAVYRIYDHKIFSLSLSYIMNDVSTLSPANIVTLLWSCSRFLIIDDKYILNILLELKRVVSNNQLSLSDFSLVSDSLRSLYYEHQHILQLNNQINSTSLTKIDENLCHNITNEARMIMSMVTYIVTKNEFHNCSINCVVSVLRGACAMRCYLDMLLLY